MTKLSISLALFASALSSFAADIAVPQINRAKANPSETPTMGWSSWNTYHIDISDKLIMHQADLIKELGLDKFGYVFINVDDGWFGLRDSNGRLKTHPERFPHGLKPMCDYIHSLGLKAGIYSDAGENTCGSRYDNDPWGVGVGFWNHDDQDAQYLFGDHDFDFIKIDFGGGEPLGNSLGIHMDEEERYTAIRRAIDKVRPGVRINICRWDYPGTWVRNVGSSWRICRDIKPQWKVIKWIIKDNLYLGAFASPGAYNDMDSLEAGRGLSKIEDYTHFAVWCFMSSPLTIGCDCERLKKKPELFNLLTDKLLISLNQDTVDPQGSVVKRDGEAYVLVRDIEEAFGTKRALLFVNLDDKQNSVSVDYADIDLAPLPGNGETLIEANLPAHGSRVVIVEGSRRLERRIYEAESAFLPCYQELKKPEEAHTPYHKEDPSASGGVYVAGLGRRPENCIVWEKVWSEKGGEYSLSFDTIAGAPSEMYVSINGTAPSRLDVVPGTPPTLNATFNSGVNSVLLFHPTSPMPGIDTMRVAKRE